MKNIKWLSALANKNPLLFSLVLLMIAVGAMSSVIISLDSKITECAEERKELDRYYKRRVDSVDNYYRLREYQLNEEVKKTLNSIIEDYKNQLEEQKNLADKVTTTIKRNKNLIYRNKNRLKNLK